jgi:hypothetical protein
MLEMSQDLPLGDEAMEGLRGCQTGTEQLDGDVAPVVLGKPPGPR